jgi:predicted DNA-binding transcriptional regulator AlpA
MARQRPRRLPLLGVKELAAQLGISRSSLAARRKNPSFPKPVAEPASGPIWHQADIDAYLRNDSSHPSSAHYQLLDQILHNLPMPDRKEAGAT